MAQGMYRRHFNLERWRERFKKTLAARFVLRFHMALILAIGSGDTPTLMAITFGVAILVVIFNVLADVVYAVLDPRIKLS